MSVQERIRECLLLEKMRENKETARDLGLYDVSEIKLYDGKEVKSEKTRNMSSGKN